MQLFDVDRDTPRLFVFHDIPSGLRALLCIDDLSLGPAAGGIRTRRYPSEDAALQDAQRLSRAMTLKCALANVDAGGAKTVVMLHPGMKRELAFEALGRHIEELQGLYLAAGDLGTTTADLQSVAKHTSWVRTDEGPLGAAVAKGLLACVQACAQRRQRELPGLRVAIQGCGAIGSAVAVALHEAGAELWLADIDDARATELAATLGASTLDPDEVLSADVDVLCPCGPGEIIGQAEARDLKAWALCGGANNIVRDARAAAVLVQREIVHVPDVISSAGAVLQGVAETVMGCDDTTHLFAELEQTARRVLDESLNAHEPADKVAERLAHARIAKATRE